MIARLAGTLIHKQPPLMVIDVAGVGYEIEAPLSVFYDLPELGQSVVILTHLSIKDDSHTFFFRFWRIIKCKQIEIYIC